MWKQHMEIESSDYERDQRCKTRGGGVDLLGKKTLFCREQDFRKHLVSFEHAKGKTNKTKSEFYSQALHFLH